MTHYYTQTIPYELAEKLKEKGMPMIVRPIAEKGKVGMISYATYASCFDWLMERGKVIAIEVEMDERNEIWEAYICWMADNLVPSCKHLENYPTWHEAADAAIEKALELIK